MITSPKNLLLAITLSLLSISCVPSVTHAWFSNTETSEAITISTGILAIDLSATSSAVAINTQFNDEEKITMQVLPVVDSLEMQYTVSLETVATSSFCDELSIVAKREGVTEYSGALLAFNVPASKKFGEWEFALSLPSNTSISAGDVCVTNIRFLAWRAETPTVEESGFWDEEHLLLTVTAIDSTKQSSGIILNEFLPHPKGEQYGFDFGSDSSDKPQGEWVELYNTNDTSVDLTGWYITDENGGEGNTVAITLGNLTAHVSPETTIIPANGYLTIYMNKAVFNNTGDTVKLYDSFGVLVDSFKYGDDPTACANEPTEGEENVDTTIGVCNASNVPANKSFARIPDGEAWVDPIPTPGAPNIATKEDLKSESWSDEEITRVLGTLNNADSDLETEESTTTKSNGLQSLGNEEAKLDDEPEEGNSIEEIDDASGEDDIEDTGSSEVGMEDKDTLVENEVEVQTQTVEERSIEGTNEDINVTSEELDAGGFEEEDEETMTDSGTEAAENKTESVEENESIGSEGESTDESNSPDAAEIEPEESESQTDTANTGDAAISNPATA